MKYKDFTEMPVWKTAFELIVKIYEATKQYPAEEKFGLISDMRRSANSVAHNIAEGFGRYEARDKTRFYKISRGSAYEIVSQLLVSDRLGFINNSAMRELVNVYYEVIKDLDSLIFKLET